VGRTGINLNRELDPRASSTSSFNCILAKICSLINRKKPRRSTVTATLQNPNEPRYKGNMLGTLFLFSNNQLSPKRKKCTYIWSEKRKHFTGKLFVPRTNIFYKKKTNPPPPGGTAILPEYVHYYGYYYQVIVHC
jgi:hypothetical protein